MSDFTAMRLVVFVAAVLFAAIALVGGGLPQGGCGDI